MLLFLLSIASSPPLSSHTCGGEGGGSYVRSGCQSVGPVEGLYADTQVPGPPGSAHSATQTSVHVFPGQRDFSDLT